MVAGLVVAVGQGIGSTLPIEREIRRSGAQVRSIVEQAAGAGARLVAFTEGALSTYPHKRRISSDPTRVAEADWSRMPWDALHEEVTLTQRLAKRLSVWVIVGTVWQDDPDVRPLNGLLVIDPDGEIATRYDKRYLSRTEAEYLYRPGSEPVVVEVDGFRIGLLLCIEALLPDAVIEYETLGVDAVIISTSPIRSHPSRTTTSARWRMPT